MPTTKPKEVSARTHAPIRGGVVSLVRQQLQVSGHKQHAHRNGLSSTMSKKGTIVTPKYKEN